MAELREKQESGLEQPGPIECKAYGHVSKLTVSKGLLVLEGWWADTSGGLPEALAVRLRGRHCIAEEVLRVKRPDVMRHLGRSEEHTSELQSLMRISYAVFCLKKKIKKQTRQAD